MGKNSGSAFFGYIYLVSYVFSTNIFFRSSSLSASKNKQKSDFPVLLFIFIFIKHKQTSKVILKSNFYPKKKNYFIPKA